MGSCGVPVSGGGGARQVGNCGVYVSGGWWGVDKHWIGRHVCSAGMSKGGRRLRWKGKLAPFGRPLALEHREASLAELVGSRLHISGCLY